MPDTAFLALNDAVAQHTNPFYLSGPCLVPVPLFLALGSSSVLSLGFLGDA